ncbi:TPA: hypothetical protein N3552_001913 [Klebsiella variicola]|uniref:hypothetical protein n=1 Tax=Klebsiella oxytoca TaxID=571 RepID=UPI0034D371E7|nr:hypothetical protein [Klebsiella quasipneumoniae subsp. quasipneumoniae]HCI4651129.1 hypothetical protein [Klebsiella quasipneumoniae subsp. quasipneumoniae]HCM8069541.1 hypothetical protein [Klebsiella variicola]
MSPESDITLIRHMVQKVITRENERHKISIIVNRPCLMWILLVWATSVGFIIVSVRELRPESGAVLLAVTGILLLLVVTGIFYLAGSPVVRIPRRYHFPDNIPSLAVSGTDLIALSQTLDTLQQMVKDWIATHKDIRYDELYRLAQDCHRQGLYRRVVRRRLIARYQQPAFRKRHGTSQCR